LAQYELNLRDYFRIFRKRRLIIIITFILVTFLTATYTSMQPVVYRSETTVKIEERKTIAGLLTEWIMYNPADVMESEAKIIKGYPVMRKVALRLAKVNDKTSLGQISDIVSQLQSSIETERVANTNMIRIIATSGNAKDAMELANTTAEVYIEENLLEKAKQFRQTRQFIEEQLSSLENRLRRAEERLEQFGDNIKKIKLDEAIQQKLVDLDSQLAELLQKYTDKHPLVIQLKERIKEIESHLKGFSGQELEYARLSREVEVNKKLYILLKEKLEEARITEAQRVSDVSIVNPAAMPGPPLSGSRNLGILLGAILGLILGITFAFTFEALDTSIGTIEDVENVLKLPVLGVIPSFKAELKKKQSFTARLKERIFPALNTETEEKLTRLTAHYFPKSYSAEAYRNIQTNLKLNSSKKTIMVTSSGPREGKSNVVTNLGIVMAQAGLKILLVSADLRRPVLAKAFGLKKEPGLNELIMGTADLETALNNITDIMVGEMKFEDITKTPGIENIWIIPSGHLPSNPVEVLGSKEITNLIGQFKSRFDVVIFDAPPVLLVTDASILAPKMDCVLIVYEIGRTSREALLRTKIQLESTGAKIAGVVLNNTRSQTEDIASYPYYHYKYRYYGKHELSDRDKTEKQEDST